MGDTAKEEERSCEREDLRQHREEAAGVGGGSKTTKFDTTLQTSSTTCRRELKVCAKQRGAVLCCFFVQAANKTSMLRWALGIVSPSRFQMAPLQADATMRAALYRTQGDPSVLELDSSVPTPIPAPGSRQVLIDVRAAGLNPVDCKLRKNPLPEFLRPLPKILGCDVSGIVKLAPPGSRFHQGDRVFAMLPPLGTTYGGCTEQCVVEESELALAPEGVNFTDLASLPLVSCTVVQALRPVVAAHGGKDRLRGKKCFVSAGSGGLGVLAIQYCARVLGMDVLTSASPRNFALLESLGASRCIDYNTQSLSEHVRGVDVFFDSLGWKHEEQVMAAGSEIVAEGGWYIRIASSPFPNRGEQHALSPDPLGLAIPEARLDRIVEGYARTALSQLHTLGFSLGILPPPKIKYHFVLVTPDGLALEEIAAAVKAGQVRAVVQEVFPLSQVQQAAALLEMGHVTGKLVIDMRE